MEERTSEGTARETGPNRHRDPPGWIHPRPSFGSVSRRGFGFDDKRQKGFGLEDKRGFGPANRCGFGHGKPGRASALSAPRKIRLPEQPNGLRNVRGLQARQPPVRRGSRPEFGRRRLSEVTDRIAVLSTADVIGGREGFLG